MNILTKSAAAVGGIALVASLAACAEGTGTEPQVSTVTVSESTSATTAPTLQPDDKVVPPPATSAASPVMDDEFLDYLMLSVAESEGIYLPEGMGAAYAQDVCDLLGNGNSVFDVVRIAQRDLPELGLDSGDHAYLVGASIGGACPQYEYMVG